MIERESNNINSNENLISPEILAGVQEIEQTVRQMKLGEKLKVSVSVSKKGKPLISVNAGAEFKDSAPILLAAFNEGSFKDKLRVLERAFPGPDQDMTAVELLMRDNFKQSSITERVIPTDGQGNEFLNPLAGAETNCIPVFYGSTSGLNMAEVWETMICAQSLRDRNIPSYVIFDTGGHESEKAYEMLNDSVKALPDELKASYDAFCLSLGETIEDQRLTAARLMASNAPLAFVSHQDIFNVVSEPLTVGKMSVLARLAGGDPKVLENARMSDLVMAIDQGLLDPSTPFEELSARAAGFAMYAREVVIADESTGFVAFPLKMTTHANIYKILERYGALAAQKDEGGALLCPLTRHRIQTRSQSLLNSDPCDATVLAFLADRFPTEFEQLREAFNSSCRVLTPDEAIRAGTTDKRFIIEDYFPL